MCNDPAFSRFAFGRCCERRSQQLFELTWVDVVAEDFNVRLGPKGCERGKCRERWTDDSLATRKHQEVGRSELQGGELVDVREEVRAHSNAVNPACKAFSLFDVVGDDDDLGSLCDQLGNDQLCDGAWLILLMPHGASPWSRTNVPRAPVKSSCSRSRKGGRDLFANSFEGIGELDRFKRVDECPAAFRSETGQGWMQPNRNVDDDVRTAAPVSISVLLGDFVEFVER